MIGRSIKSIAITILFSLFCATPLFGQGLAKSIVGTWTGNSEATKNYWKENKMEEKERLLEDASKMTIKFGKDGKLELRRKREQEDFVIAGNYEVLKTDESKKVLTVKLVPSGDNGPGPEEVEVSIKLINIKMKPAIAISPKNDPVVVFTRDQGQKPDKNKDSATKKEKATTTSKTLEVIATGIWPQMKHRSAQIKPNKLCDLW